MSLVSPKLTYQACRSMSGMEKSRHQADIAARLLMTHNVHLLRYFGATQQDRRTTPPIART